MFVRSVFLSVVVALLAGAGPVRAQTEGVLPLGDAVQTFLERQQAAGRLSGAHLVHRPLSAYAAQRLLDSLAAARPDLGRVDRALLARFRGTAPAPGAAWVHRRVPLLYADGRTFFSVRGDGYALHAEPLLYLTYGPAPRRSWDGDRLTAPAWRNTRGVRAAGHLGRYLFFESRIEETQERVPSPARSGRTAPRLPFLRPGGDVYDYQLATGLVGVRSRFFEVRFGRDRRAWGPGATSLVLSGYAPAFDALQIRTNVWRLEYVNLFAALQNLTFVEGTRGRILPRKYAALHHLSLHVGERVQVGLFQGIVFASDTAAVSQRRGFDVAYLNPVLFLRPAEADRGDADNVLLGADLAVRAGPGRVYGELVLDEFRLSEVGRAWWANKWGVRVGAEAADLVGPSLLRVEYARLRPYLYAHRTPLNAYTHYDDVLGHPAGPNTLSLLATLHAWITPRLPLTVAVLHVVQGRGADGANVGADPLLSYSTRVRDRDVEILQGVRRRTLAAEGAVSYELLPGLHAGGAVRVLLERDEVLGRRGYVAPGVLLRWGMPYAFARL